MVHNIRFKDRNNIISCYLPEDCLPEKNAVAELYQMTELEETLNKLREIPCYSQSANLQDRENYFDTRLSQRFWHSDWNCHDDKKFCCSTGNGK